MNRPTRIDPALPARIAYEDDFYGWTVEQAALLRAGRLDAIDAPNIAEALDDLGDEQYHRLANALTIVLLHLLKWDHQPERRGASWEASIREHRRRVVRQLKRNPGLKSRLDEALEEAYEDARDRARAETGLPLAAFPPERPYDWWAIMEREIAFDG